MAIKKSITPARKPVVVADDDDDDKSPAEQPETDTKAEVSSESEDTAKAEVNVPTVSVERPPETVTMTMLEDISPAPVVGVFDCARKLNVLSLKKGASYKVPTDVAAHIQDAGKCIVSP